MQKAHSRINWENLPSINTPLGANNLNKMDKSLDVIDDRVLSLYGYEGRVAQSEKNAKTSETNAKVSEINSKQSELKAKEYMENAFNGTPEGYDNLVEYVRLMDIQTTTEQTLANSKEGGYKLVSMNGASVQNAPPTPDAPQSINNVGDSVKMVQGYYSPSNNGMYVASNYIVCNKNKIPCNANDVVKLICEELHQSIYFLFYDENKTYIGNAYGSNLSEFSITVSTNAKYINFYLLKESNVEYLLDKVEKISLTINGKYMVLIVENGKNQLDCGKLISTTTNGITFTPSYNLKGELEYININGTATDRANYNLNMAFSLSAGNYIYNGVSGGSTTTYGIFIGGITFLANESVDFTLTEDKSGLNTYISVFSGVKMSNIKFYPMIRKSDITDDSYEPYKEKVAKVLLNEPLRESDLMGRTEVARKRASVVFDGSDDEVWQYQTLQDSSCFIIPLSNFNYVSDTELNYLCTHYSAITVAQRYIDKTIFINSGSNVFITDNSFTTLADFKTWLASNPVTVEYELAEKVIEELDEDSQIALNSLETFDTVTYVSVDSRVQPSEIKGEYGTSMVGARTIKNELRNDTLEIKYNELAVALVATESGV